MLLHIQLNCFWMKISGCTGIFTVWRDSWFSKPFLPISSEHTHDGISQLLYTWMMSYALDSGWQHIEVNSEVATLRWTLEPSHTLQPCFLSFCGNRDPGCSPRRMKRHNGRSLLLTIRHTLCKWNLCLWCFESMLHHLDKFECVCVCKRERILGMGAFLFTYITIYHTCLLSWPYGCHFN